MPKDNEESYKEMYEMGQRLVEMAKAGGYDPESEESEESEDYEMEESEEEMPSKSMGSKDKVSSALSLFKQ